MTAAALPGRRFGTTETPLRIRRYASTGDIEVTIATLVVGSSPVLSPDQALTTRLGIRETVANSATQVTLRGLNLKPTGATAASVALEFSSDCGSAPEGKLVPSGLYNNTRMEVQLIGLDQTCSGLLLASVTVGGAASADSATAAVWMCFCCCCGRTCVEPCYRCAGVTSGDPVPVAAVHAPVINPSKHRVAANAVELHVTGTNLPPQCVQDPADIDVGGLSVGSLLRANLTLGTHFTLFGCSATSFTMRLLQGDTHTPTDNAKMSVAATGHRWHPITGNLRILRYSTSGPLDVRIAQILPAFNGQITRATASVINTGLASHSPLPHF